MLTSWSVLDGERRQVTVRFADLAGFTSLAAQRDPEEVHEIIDGCFERIPAEAPWFEGTAKQDAADGVMALVGMPIAHEDSLPRAMRAALGATHADSFPPRLTDVEACLIPVDRHRKDVMPTLQAAGQQLRRPCL
jgi:class 3 adenylate cyclase